MNLYCQPFETDRLTDPKKVQEQALKYANKVSSSGDVFTVTESVDDYGYYVTVWYRSMKKVEV